MSRIFGPVRQIGYVVLSLDEAIDHWTRQAGVGPFFRFDHMALSAFRVGGVETAIDLSVACAQSGPIQIELVEQHNLDASPYKDFLDRHGPGMQHLGVWSQTYDADIARLVAAGRRIAFEGESAAARFTYFDAPYAPGCFMEVAEFSPILAAACQQIADAAVDWDGLDPVRQLTI